MNPSAMTAERGVLQAISKSIEVAVGEDDPTLFFACFLRMPWGIAYVSNGARGDIQKLLPELARRIEGGLPKKPAATEPSRVGRPHDDVRLAVERKCAEVGERLAEIHKVALFVFKNDEDCPGGIGVNAWFANLPGAPEQIRAWLAKGRA